MKTLQTLFANNQRWAARMQADDPEYFADLSRQQAPPYLWIGCADSRVPANQICGLKPGEVFVHRNIANVVTHTDFSCLSVLQYAVEVLQVKHIIVCGHYGCGGVGAALSHQSLGLIDNWVRHIKDVYVASELPKEPSEVTPAVFDALCELNVAASVHNVCHTTIVQDAWRRGQELNVHGWIYGLTDGLLKDLDLCVTAPEQVPSAYRLRKPVAA